MLADRSLSLPAGTHYAVTTGVGVDFKGLTTAMLTRSRGFVEQTGRTVTIVTHRPFDYDEVRAALRDRGLLVDGMSLLNLFEDVATWDAVTMREILVESAPDTDTVSELLRDDDPAVTVDRYRRTLSVDGKIIQVDHRREDGSVFISGRRHDARPAYVLYDADGEVIGGVASERELLHRWLDTLPRDPMAWMIVDSRVSAGMLVHYRRTDVAVMHVLHYSHLVYRPGDQPPKVRSTSADILERMDDLDAIVFLTETQLHDVGHFFGAGTGNRFSVPNVCEIPDVSDLSVFTRRRDRRRGVMLARFDRGKRVHHAIRAIASVSGSFDPRKRPRLDVYGGGPRRGLLEAEIESTAARQRTPLRRVLSRALGDKVGWRLAAALEPAGSARRTTLHGHVTNAREEFWKASFSLLTSRAEGSPLVLVESMSRGAIPISFDIKYGPRDVITDGVDGFVVPFAGPRKAEKALAAAIRRVVTMSHAELSAMRIAARRRSLDFTADSVTRRWIDVMTTVGERKA